ncbi:hypothetical protein CHH28_08400 [Bacterioplanes sanyensis]|uniref:Membrane fusion protein biotin-lipoyl like domain-containing protein n=1 Tax=Bacterioplanes sanyensis TaxID=1249553 RepID=A0A222FIX2_9GAMM|nr:biotin/lipoyl-binding protein [Bacterioplanes sanyensis]ASP38699.1 hypothetical protein CHH28_08400 [Bacterioplanes sanyensis]
MTAVKKWPGLAALALAAVIMVLLLVNKTGPQQRELDSQATAVYSINTESQPIRPFVEGFGQVSASQHFQAVAEVAGRIVALAPGLEQGMMYPAGTEIVTLDDQDYQLALAQAKAQAQVAEQQLQQFAQQSQQLKTSLRLTNERLQYAQSEVERLQRLFKQGSVSASQLDGERQRWLQLQQEQVSLRTQVEQLPSQQRSLVSQKESAEAQVAQQQRNIERTHIRLPFAARLGAVDFDIGQFVGTGQVLFAATGLDTVDVIAHVSLARLKPFFAALAKPDEELLLGPEVMEQLLQRFQLSAEVELPGFDGRWAAQVVSIHEALDPASHSIAFTLRVPQQQTRVRPGVRPPLLPRAQVNVRIYGHALPGLLVPRIADHQGQLYVMEQQRLKFLPTPAHLLMGPWLFIYRPTMAELQVITSPLIPALPGQLLTASPDPDWQPLLHQSLQNQTQQNQPPQNQALPPTEQPQPSQGQRL